MLLKYWNYSTNPFWATTDSGSGGWNITGLALAAASLYEYYTRPSNLFPAQPINTEKDKPIAPVHTSSWQRLTVIFGLGSLVHMLQTFLMDAGTIIAWTWTGFPVKGPTLHPFAGVVIAITALLVLLNVETRSASYIWSCIGIGGAYFLYSHPDWSGFLGGMAFTAYLVAVTPRLLRIASTSPPARIFGWAMVVNIVLDVASVVTAAYAFVPMGWLLRERTDLVLGFCVVCLVIADLSTCGMALPGKDRLYPRSIARIGLTKKLNMLAALVVAVLGISTSYYKIPTSQPTPYYPDHRIFSGGIWTVSSHAFQAV